MDNTKRYVDWVAHQCETYNHNYFPTREEITGMDQDLYRELTQACRNLPNGTPAQIRAEFFRLELEDAIPVVLEDFDLCGRLSLDGKMCRVHRPPEEYPQEEVDRALAKHPLRLFGNRWDHAAAETERFLTIGIDGEQARISERLARPATPEQQDFLHAMATTLTAFSRFIERHIAPAQSLGKQELADALAQIAHGPARTFYEALLLINLRFVAWSLESRQAMALGRMDRHLNPYLQADLAAGSITRDKAEDLLQQFVAMLAVGYINPVHSLTVGGTLADGTDGANDVSYMLLDVFKRQKLPGVNLFARVHRKTAPAFIDACADAIFTGGGMPAICNEELSYSQLADYDVLPQDAATHIFTGCAHLNLEGMQVPWTEGTWSVVPQLVNDMLEELWQSPQTDEPTWDSLLDNMARKIDTSIALAVKNYNLRLAACNPKNSPDVFYSVFVDDCIERALEYNDGGARYKGVLGIDIYALGLGVDMLAVLKTLVIEQKTVTLEELKNAVKANFEGCELLRQRLLHDAPKYGNDDDVTNQLAKWIVDQEVAACHRHQDELQDGSKLRVIFPGTLGYVILGDRFDATIDGRLAKAPLSDSGSPMAGRDCRGLTALINSLGCVDHSGFTGMALNIRLNYQDFQDEGNHERFRAIIGVMMDKGIQELQFNCFSTELLHEAQKRPEDFSNLAIRVAGYSALFTMLQKAEQDAIIARNEHA